WSSDVCSSDLSGVGAGPWLLVDGGDLFGGLPVGVGGAGEVVEEQGALVGAVAVDDVGDAAAGGGECFVETCGAVEGFDDDFAAVGGVGGAADVAGLFEAVDEPGGGAGGEAGACAEFAGCHGSGEFEDVERVEVGGAESDGSGACLGVQHDRA